VTSRASEAAAFVAAIPGLAEWVEERAAEIADARIREAGVVASPWLTVNEAAEYLHWPRKRVYQLTAAGAIPHRRHERRILLRRDELDEWLADAYAGPPEYRPGPAAGVPGVFQGRGRPHG
jgi:excisionase family DNA binding protein